MALEKIRKVVQKQSAQPRKQMLVYIVVYGIALALVLVPILLFVFVSFFAFHNKPKTKVRNMKETQQVNLLTLSGVDL